MTQLGRLYEKEKIEYGNQKAKEAEKEMAVKMLVEGIDIIKIMKVTGLSEEELIKLQKEASVTV